MKYKHYPKEIAYSELKKGQAGKYKVVTINWTYAGNDRKDKQIDYNRVHKNEYTWTLRHLIQWIRDTDEVAEDIISIEPIDDIISYKKKVFEIQTRLF